MNSGIQADSDIMWAAFVFAVGSCAVIGAIRASRRLHRTQSDARGEAEGWAQEMRLGPLNWEAVDAQSVIARAGDRAVLLRSIQLPA